MPVSLETECDFGYEKTTLSEKCVMTEEVSPDMSPCEMGSNTYYATQGYRKVPADVCVNGLPQYEPVEKPCKETPPTDDPQNSNPSRGASGAVIAAVVAGSCLLVIVGCIAGVYIGFRFQKQKRLFSQLQVEEEDSAITDMEVYAD